MTSHSLLILGTPAGRWEALAREAFGAAFASVGTDALQGIAPDRPCLVIVESPAAALAGALAAGSVPAVDAWIASWREGATRLLQFLQRRPQRCLVVSIAALTAPAALAAAVARRFGSAPTCASVAAPATLDPLALAIAEGIVAGEPELRALATELAVCCAPMGAAAVAAASRDDALRRLRALTDAGSEAVRLRAALQRSEVELEEHYLAHQAVLAQAQTNAKPRREQELLELQVRQLRAEVEQYYRAYTQLQAAGAAGAGAGWGPQVSVGEVSVVSVRNEEPHCECAFELADVRRGEQVLGRLELRLVEHRGMAGIVFFADPQRPPVLRRWHESGREGALSYLLLIPGDANTRAALDDLAASDWRLVKALLARLERATSDPRAGARWLQVARRLRQQLDELPARLRFDDVTLAAPADASARAIDFHFDDATCAEAIVDGPLKLRWYPDAAAGTAGGRLEIALGETPWPSWPRAADGRPVDRLVLPLGAALAAPGARDAWQALTAADRAAALGIVRALPEILARAGGDAWPAWAERARMQEHARTLLAETTRHLQPSRLRRLVRVLRDRDLQA